MSDTATSGRGDLVDDVMWLRWPEYRVDAAVRTRPSNPNNLFSFLRHDFTATAGAMPEGGSDGAPT